MFDVVMNLVVRVQQEQERSGDEGEFQIAAITAPGGSPEIELHRVALSDVPRPVTDNLFAVTDRAELDLRVASISEADPYFAFAIRAVEFDSSSDDMRQGDRDRFVASIRAAIEPVFDGGGQPTASTIWSAGHAARLADRRNQRPSGLLAPWWWRDDDDRIGVSARTYQDLGEIFAASVPSTPGSQIRGTRQWTELAFVEEGAVWRMAASVGGRWPR